MVHAVFDHTSIPGFSHYNQRRGIRSFVWLCLGLAGVALTILQVTTILIGFFTYQVVTRVSLQDQEKLEVPTITFCTFNQVSCPRLLHTLKLVKEGGNKEVLCEMLGISGCPYDKAAEILPCTPGMLKNTWRENLTWSEYDPARQRMVFLREQLPYDVMEAVTPAAPEVLLYCSNPEGKCTNKTTELNLLDDIVREQKCFDPSLTKDQLDRMMTQMTDPKVVPNMPYFTNNVSPKYGNCLYFNLFNGLVQETLGMNGGLSVLFRTSDRDGPRVGAFFSQDGMVVQVSSTGQLNTNSEGFFVRPGTVASLALERSTRVFLPHPYPSNCVSSWEDTIFAKEMKGSFFFEIMNTLKYNRGLCESFCNARASLRECGCHISAFDAVNVRYLWREKNQEGLDCIMPACSNITACIRSDDQNMEESCGCYSECESEYFNTQVSSATWPVENVWHQLAHEYSTKAGVGISEEETRRKYEGRMAKIDVYFRSRKRLVIEEMPKYKDFSVLLTELGGALSAYLGLSAFTFVDLFEFAWDRLRERIGRFGRNKTAKTMIKSIG